MDFSLTEEQQLLQDTVRRFIDQEYAFEARRARMQSDAGFSRDTWKTFADLGLLGIPFAEAYGGFGGSAVDTMLVMEQFGRGLVVEPYLATVVLGGSALALGGTEAQKAKLLPQVAQGKLLLALACGEPRGRYELNNVESSARRDGSGYLINGGKAVVVHGAAADKLIVSARTAGHTRDAEGISLFIVDRSAAGLAVRSYPTIDGLHAAEISLANVRVSADAVLGSVGGALPLLEHVVDLGIAALCAEAVGAMDALNTATLEYLKTRQQFGVPIGRFQALQHRMVDMLMHFEQAKSMSILAAVKTNSKDRSERSRAVSAAKVQIGRCGRFIGQQAIQLHGGMGMTDELNVSHYFKRVTMIDSTLGDTAFHLARFAESETADGVLARLPFEPQPGLVYSQ